MPITDTLIGMSEQDTSGEITFVTAGFPNAAKDAVSVPLDLNHLLVKHPTATFYMRVEGDALRNEGILPGDIVMVDRSLTVYNNAIIVAGMQGELILRKFRRDKTGVYLQTDNDSDLLTISPELEFEVWGIVVTVIRQMH